VAICYGLTIGRRTPYLIPLYVTGRVNNQAIWLAESAIAFIHVTTGWALQMNHKNLAGISTACVSKTLLLILVVFGATVEEGNANDTTNFTDFPDDRAFIDLPAERDLNVESALGIDITPSRFSVLGSVASSPLTTGPDDPGDNAGYIAIGDADSTLVLDFSDGVAGFGVTFLHSDSVNVPTDSRFPASLNAFSGLNGTGNLLGSVLSSGPVGPRNFVNADFVGIFLNNNLIRSVVLEGTGPSRRFGVDAYGVAVIAVPEPNSVALIAVVSASLAFRRRKSGWVCHRRRV